MSTAIEVQKEQLATENSQLANWVPMPRYLLRCWVVKNIIRKLNARDFIEIGAASGEMALWMSDRGMNGTAVEISPSALLMLRQRLHGCNSVEVFDRDSEHLKTSADLLLSMEVLEHIEDDRAALSDWYRLVNPGGNFVMSVPAHPSMFSAEDEMAGHYRRYTKQDLIQKIQEAGFQDVKVYAYGFPVGLILKKLRTYVAKRRLTSDDRSQQERTEASGVERKRFLPMRWLLNDICFLPFNLIQMPFLKLDWTDGYIAVARKPTEVSR